jgi:hypothetical protein
MSGWPSLGSTAGGSSGKNRRDRLQVALGVPFRLCSTC